MEDTFLTTNIIDCIQAMVDQIAESKWAEDYKDGGDLNFWVSRCFDNKEDKNEKIILTINHMGWKYSRVLYPQQDSFYGLSPLEEIMVSLYNQTM
jgi:hypothetical protein